MKKLNSKKVQQVKNYLKKGKTHRWIHEKTGVSMSTISRIRQKTRLKKIEVKNKRDAGTQVRVKVIESRAHKNARLVAELLELDAKDFRTVVKSAKKARFASKVYSQAFIKVKNTAIKHAKNPA